MLSSKMIKGINQLLPSVLKYSFKNERSYRKGLRRKPIRIISENNIEENIKKISKNDVMDNLKQENDIKIKSKRTIEIIKPEIPPYEKLGEKSQPFTKAMTLLKSRKQREKAGKILLEGKRLINDAIDAGADIEAIFFSKEENLNGINFKKIPNVKIMKVFYKELSLWSDLTTCPGIMGIFKVPDSEKIVYLNEKTIPLIVICDNVRDPGNMGSILRCGAAIGCEKIILMKGCVDVWDPKVLRSGCGAHFRVPIINDISWNIINTYIPENASIFLADNQTNLSDLNTINSFSDSLNERFIEANDEEILVVDNSFEDKNMLKKYKHLHIPQYKYTDISFEDKCVLLIGGETKGLSLEARKLGTEYNGCCITIPIENNVESLNSAISMAIIGFEIKRQFSVKYSNELILKQQ